MQIQVVPADRPVACPVCKDGLQGATWRCDGCDTLLHPECAAMLRECPTLGCRRATAVAPPPAPPLLGPPPERPGRWAPILQALGITVGVVLVGQAVRAALVAREPPPTPPVAPQPAPVLQPGEVLIRAGAKGEKAVRLRVDLGGAGVRFQVDGVGWELQLRGFRAERTVDPYLGYPSQLVCVRAEGGITVRYGVTREGNLVPIHGSPGLDIPFPVRVGASAPEAPAATPEGWAARLRSDDPAAVMEALYWLGRGARGKPGAESAARAARSPEVHQALRKLREQGDPWMREVAAAVLVASE